MKRPRRPGKTRKPAPATQATELAPLEALLEAPPDARFRLLRDLERSKRRELLERRRQAQLVPELRALGVSWDHIGRALQITRQGARQLHGKGEIEAARSDRQRRVDVG